MRIVQFSDTHISHLGGIGHDNTERLVDYLNEVAEPDLAVNTGDVVILDPDSAADRAAALRIHERIDAPLRVIPGNHDVGECAPEPWKGIRVSSQRVRDFRSAWGSDRFVLFGDAAREAEGWAFVGINSELCAAGMAVWAPSLSFAPAAQPHLKFGPGAAGIVEYSVRGQQVDARFVAVPGIEGVADFAELPEVQASMAALSRKSA